MQEITPQLLRDTVGKLRGEDGYKAACRRIGASFKEAGGYKAAAKQVLEFAAH